MLRIARWEAWQGRFVNEVTRKRRVLDPRAPCVMRWISVATCFDDPPRHGTDGLSGNWRLFIESLGRGWGRCAETMLLRTLQYAGRTSARDGVIRVDRAAFGAIVLSRSWDVVSSIEGGRVYDALIGSGIAVEHKHASRADSPSAEPSAEPGAEPSAEPGAEPSAEPGAEPSAEPGAGNSGDLPRNPAQRARALHRHEHERPPLPPSGRGERFASLSNEDTAELTQIEAVQLQVILDRLARGTRCTLIEAETFRAQRTSFAAGSLPPEVGRATLAKWAPRFPDACREAIKSLNREQRAARRGWVAERTDDDDRAEEARDAMDNCHPNGGRSEG